MIGENFDGNNVRVVVRDVTRNNNEVVFRDRVMPNAEGDFRVRLDPPCEGRFRTFEATARSARDGVVTSEPLRVNCRDLR